MFEVGFEVVEYFNDDVFDTAFGEAGGGGDLVMAEAFLAAHTKDALLLFGELAEGVVDEALAVAQVQQVVRRAAGLLQIGPQFVLQAGGFGYLLQELEGLVADDGVYIIARVVDLCQQVPVLPEGDEGFLEDLFGVGGGMGKRYDEAVHFGLVQFKKLPESGFAVVSDLREQGFLAYEVISSHWSGA